MPFVPGPSERVHPPASTKSPVATAAEQTQRFQEVKTKALADKKVQELQAKADNATGDEARPALRQYYKALYARMREIDPSLHERIQRTEAASLRRADRSGAGQSASRRPRGVREVPSMPVKILPRRFRAVIAVSALAQPPLQVRGNELLAGGQPIRLRGVAVGDPILAREGRPLSDYERIAHDWHANVVRISLHPSVWKHSPHAEVLAKVKRDVDAALANGLYVILDWHTIGWPDGYYEKIAAAWDDDPKDLYDSNFALAESFWNEASALVRHRTAASSSSFGTSRSGRKNDTEPDVPPEWEKLRPYFEKLLAIVRRHGSNVVLATGNGWAYDLQGIREDPLPGKNVAYCWHIYADTDDNDEKEWAKHLDALQTVAPVIVTRMGLPGAHRGAFPRHAQNLRQ